MESQRTSSSYALYQSHKVTLLKVGKFNRPGGRGACVTESTTFKCKSQCVMPRVLLKLLDSITNSVGVNLSKLWETVEERGAWCATIHRVAKVGHDLATQWQKQQQN